MSVLSVVIINRICIILLGLWSHVNNVFSDSLQNRITVLDGEDDIEANFLEFLLINSDNVPKKLSSTSNSYFESMTYPKCLGYETLSNCESVCNSVRDGICNNYKCTDEVTQRLTDGCRNCNQSLRRNFPKKLVLSLNLLKKGSIYRIMSKVSKIYSNKSPGELRASAMEGVSKLSNKPNTDDTDNVSASKEVEQEPEIIGTEPSLDVIVEAQKGKNPLVSEVGKLVSRMGKLVSEVEYLVSEVQHIESARNSRRKA